MSVSHLYVLMEAQNGALDVFHGDQHVLNHVVLLVEFADGLSLSELQKRDLRRNHPAEHIPEQRIVPEWNDILKTQRTRKFNLMEIGELLEKLGTYGQFMNVLYD